MSPVYNIIMKLGLYDTKFALILVYTALNMPISLMVLRSAFSSIPTELEEAAYIDGAGFFRTFIQVMMPCAKGGLASAAVLTFLESWNEFTFALLADQLHGQPDPAAVPELLHQPVQLQLHGDVRGHHHRGAAQHHRLRHLPEQVNASLTAGSVKG